MFTCSCGIFGCGGYYVEVIHTKDEYILKNSYKALDEPNLDSPIKIFEYHLSWWEIVSFAKEICFNLRTTKRTYSQYLICIGANGNDISNEIERYEKVIKEIENR